MGTTTTQLLIDAFDRVHEAVGAAVDGLTGDQLTHRLDVDANTIAWLAWHSARVQDDHVANVAGLEQLWTAEGWRHRFDLPFESSDIGYGHTSAQVAAVQVTSAELLTGYYGAVHQRTVRYIADLADDDLLRVVDDSYDPPVTLAVRLVSVLADVLQHAGQAAFIRGIVERAR